MEGGREWRRLMRVHDMHSLIGGQLNQHFIWLHAAYVEKRGISEIRTPC